MDIDMPKRHFYKILILTEAHRVPLSVLKEHEKTTRGRRGTKEHVRRLLNLFIGQHFGCLVPHQMADGRKVMIHNGEADGKLGRGRNHQPLTANGLHERKRRTSATHQFNQPQSSASHRQSTAGHSIRNRRKCHSRKCVHGDMRRYGTSRVFHALGIVLEGKIRREIEK